MPGLLCIDILYCLRTLLLVLVLVLTAGPVRGRPAGGVHALI
jgi:hypothetical protein